MTSYVASIGWLEAAATAGVFLLGIVVSSVAFVWTLRSRADVVDRTLAEREKAHADVHLKLAEVCHERHERLDADRAEMRAGMAKLFELQRESDQKLNLICGRLKIDIDQRR
jgi:hypothetical protein